MRRQKRGHFSGLILQTSIQASIEGIHTIQLINKTLRDKKKDEKKSTCSKTKIKISKSLQLLSQFIININDWHLIAQLFVLIF